MAIDQNAVLQYIGARYVPKFYDNPDTGDATWKSGVAYEGFTVVTYQQNSYTSKIPVPATVGNPASNGDYWVKTADWNAQLNALQNLVNEIDGDLDYLKSNYMNRTFLLFGDSLFDGYTPDESVRHGWGYWVEKYLTDKGYKVYRAEDVAGVGVSGFGTNKTYVQHLQETITQHPEIVDDVITDVIVYSGTNDRAYVNTTDQGISNFVSAIKNYWPMANIRIGYFSPHHDASAESIVNIFKTCGKWGCSYIENSAALCCRKDYLSSDGTHLNSTGYEWYSRYLTDGALDGVMSYDIYLTDIPITVTSGTISNIGVNIRVTNGKIYQSIANIGSSAGTYEFATAGENPGEIGGLSFNMPITLRLRLGVIASFPVYDKTNGNMLGIFELQNYSYNGELRGYVYGDTSANSKIHCRGDHMVCFPTN